MDVIKHFINEIRLPRDYEDTLEIRNLLHKGMKMFSHIINLSRLLTHTFRTLTKGDRVFYVISVIDINTTARLP